MRRPLAAAVVAAGVGLLGAVVTASGAEAAGAAGFGVSPAYSQIDVPADQATVVDQLTLTNQTNEAQTFALTTVDFGSLNEEGGVAFLGASTSSLAHKYGLAAWLRLPESTVTVPAAQSVDLAVTIENRSDLAPGGHYGAVLATAQSTSGKPAPNSVGVKPVLSALLLVTKEGGLKQSLTLAGQSSNAGWWRLPTAVQQRYQNTGNVHLVPRGVIAVEDPRGTVVARAAINPDSGIILPASFRRYTTDLLSVGTAWLPGQYRLVATYSYDGGTQMKTLTAHFWYVGAAVVWIVAALAILAIGVLGWWLLWRPRRRARKAA